MRRSTDLPFVILGWVAVCACAPPSTAPPPALQPIDGPAAPASGEPNLAEGADGQLYLSWLEADAEGGQALRFAVWEQERWSAPRTVTRGEDWFVNWADFPSLTALADGTLAAHWLVRSAPGSYAYDILLSVSRDRGATWSQPERPHADGTATEHGFVSLVPMKEAFAVLWLDGRQTAAEPPGPMTLRYATLGRDGRVVGERLLDDRVCDCCATDAALADAGALLAVYRDRTAEEIRDIRSLRIEANEPTAGLVVHDDGWKIGGCPVNGPALAVHGERAVVVWFTMTDGTSGSVRAAFSENGGRSFGRPIAVDDGEPLGRVDVVWLEDGAALVSWIEQEGDGGSIRLRRVSPSGAHDPSLAAVRTAVSRSSGFPKLARHGGQTILAWTEPGDPPRVRTALVTGAPGYQGGTPPS